jgi:DNA adenine methylase
VEVIALYDDSTTLFYCDPPYVHESRGDAKAYGHEMSDRDHEQLLDVLKNIRGKAAVSGYASSLYEKTLKHWRRIEASPKQCHSVKSERTEVLWTNY